MPGCLRNAFATIGCVTVAIVVLILGWEYRAQLAGAYRSLTGEQTPGGTVEALAGSPSPSALRAARRKEAAIAQRGGPAYIVLDADEVAALVVDALDSTARAALDSVRVTVSAGRIALEARINTAVLSPEVLGPFQGALNRNEQARIAGPAKLVGVGVMSWAPDEFSIRAFPFPASAVPRLMDKLTARRDGAVLIAVPLTVGDVRLRDDSLTLYRRSD